MNRSIALLASCAVHVAFAWLLWGEPVAPVATVVRPIEIELRPFRQVEARRAAPGPAKRQASASRRRISAPVIAPVVTELSAPAGSPGVEESSGGGGGGEEEDAGIGEGKAAPPPPPPDTAAAVLALPRVEYPLGAREDGVDGVVRLWVVVDAHGRVSSVQILEDPGSGLGEVARSALLRATFRPATHLGAAISAGFEYLYRFELQ